jgi:hypothetical protein
MKLFEVLLKEGRDRSELLSADVLEQTGAQVFTQAEAEFVGLQGLPEDPADHPRLFIAYAPADEGFLQSRLEASDAVLSFKLRELGG